MKHKLTALMAGLLLAAPAAHAEDLTIGVPIAKTNIFAFVGIPAQRGIQVAIDQANASGVLGAGRTLKLDVGDDASDRNQAITLANRMIVADKVIAIVGAAGTPPALGIAPLANQQKVPLIALATSNAVTQAGPFAYHVMAPPNVQMGAIMQYAYDHFKPKTVATVWARDNEGAVAQGKFARDWLQGKATLLPEETVLGGDTDFSALVTKLAYENPAVLIITMSDVNAANLIIQARQAGVTSQIVMSTTAVSQGLLRTGGAAVEGIVAPTDYFIGRTDALNQDFIAAYKKTFGENPDNWAADGYTAMQVVINAIKNAGPSPTPETVQAAILATKNMPSVLGAGTFSFAADREPDYPMTILTVKNGAFVLAPS